MFHKLCNPTTKIKPTGNSCKTFKSLTIFLYIKQESKCYKSRKFVELRKRRFVSFNNNKSKQIVPASSVTKLTNRTDFQLFFHNLQTRLQNIHRVLYGVKVDYSEVIAAGLAVDHRDL